MRATGLLLALLAFTGSGLAQSSHLVSQLRTNYTAGGTTYAFQWYTYDANGRLTYASTYDGTDTLSTLSSESRYAYDTGGLLTGEAIVMADDTIYEFRYAYDASDSLVEVRRLNAAGNTSYIDSLTYDTSHLLVRAERWNGSGATLRYFHALTRDGDGYIVSDTLYEPDTAASFAATQATLFTNAPDGRVLAEDAWLDHNGWYQTSRTVLDYDVDNRLIARTQYEGNGAAHVLLDSLAYEHDLLGNRTLELHYDDGRALTYRIESVWETSTALALQPAPLRIRAVEGTATERYLGACLFALNGRRTMVPSTRVAASFVVSARTGRTGLAHAGAVLD